MSAATIDLSPAVFGLAITTMGVIVTAALKIHLSTKDIERIAEDFEKHAELVAEMHEEQTRMTVLVDQHDKQITEWRALSNERYVAIMGHDGRLSRLEKDLEALGQSIHKFRGEMQARLGDLQLRARRRDGGE